MARAYAAAIAEAGLAGSVLEVLSTWSPGMVLAMAEHIEWRNALTAAEMAEARAGA